MQVDYNIKYFQTITYKVDDTWEKIFVTGKYVFSNLIDSNLR